LDIVFFALKCYRLSHTFYAQLLHTLLPDPLMLPHFFFSC
jgi:hypothetical protein